MEYRAGFSGIGRIERQPARHGRELKREPGLNAFGQIGTASIRIADENPFTIGFRLKPAKHVHRGRVDEVKQRLLITL